MSLLLAQSGHPDTLNQCPLPGVKQTSAERAGMSLIDPERKSSDRRPSQPTGIALAMLQTAGRGNDNSSVKGLCCCGRALSDFKAHGD
jgi:hypothetical protein